MKTNQITDKAKAVLCFCLILATACLIAQNTGSYKYIVNTDGLRLTSNNDILEINNRYYLLSSAFDKLGFVYKNATITVTIFDTNLNRIEQVTLSKLTENNFYPCKLLYENNYFYLFGYTFLNDETYKPCYVKVDENFNLVQDISIYTTNDNLSYDYRDILMTENNEFVCRVHQWDTDLNRLLHINNKGEVLQEVVFKETWSGVLVATDSHYLVNFTRNEKILKIQKDSFDKYEWIEIERLPNELTDGNAITVGNQLITTNTLYKSYGDWPEPSVTYGYLSIKILNEDFSVKNRLIVGEPYKNHQWGKMHYINPDSIYFAYETFTKYGNTISIANFSSEGELHFDYTLDLPKDTLLLRHIFLCKAVSNGGVLVLGRIEDYSIEDSLTMNGFLLLYHPTRDDLGVKQLRIANYELRVFPNPTTGQLRITNYELQNTDYTIYSVVGQKIMQGKLQDETTVIDVESLVKGMYYLRVGEKAINFIKE